MDPIASLILATLAFLATHFVPSTPLRRTLAGALGERVYVAVYSLVAAGLIAWMSWAYAKAPFQPLWQLPELRLLPLVVMPFALILLATGVMTRNPTAVMQEAALKAAEPARGILRVTRHPIMWGILLWAAAHVLALGDLASLVFFGGFLALAAVGTVLMDARKASTLGQDWQRFAAVTSNVPFGAIVNGRNRFRFREIGWKRVGAGLALYLVLLAAHPYLFGSRPY